jgi:hypothetical protein
MVRLWSSIDVGRVSVRALGCFDHLTLAFQNTGNIRAGLLRRSKFRFNLP